MRSRILDGGNKSSIRSRQVKAAINNWFWGGSGGGGQQNVLSKLSVKFNNTDFSYLTSSGDWSDTASFNTGANVISVAQISPDTRSGGGNNACVGLAYDEANDYIISNDFDNTRFFDRSQFAGSQLIAALTAARTLTLGGDQGIAFDLTNNRVLVFESSTVINIFDAITGSLFLATSISGIGNYGSLFYDYITGDLYVGDDAGAVAVEVYRLSGTVWSLNRTEWFTTNEGITVDYIQSKILAHRASLLVKQDRTTGFDIRQYPLAKNPGAAIDMEGIISDPRDGTIWYNWPAFFHGGIVDGNRLFHVDPEGIYRKYLRVSSMIRYEAFKIVGNINGIYSNESILSGSFNMSPVIDFIANTGQQTIGNWEGLDTENFEIEFRGAGSAPSTSATPASDYLLLPYYDANQSNDGWGATTPGAWQSTPTNDRYMQFRVKPIAFVPVPTWTPADLGSKLLYWWEWVDPGYSYLIDTNRVSGSANIKNPSVGLLSQSVTGQRPTWNSTLECHGSNTHLIDNSLATALNAISQIEVHTVSRKTSANVNCIDICVSVNGSVNNFLTVRHFAGNAGVGLNNMIGIMYSNNVGSISTLGFVSTSTAYLYKRYILGGVATRLFVNDVEQTVTVTGGSDGGWCFDDLTSPNRCTVAVELRNAVVSGNSDHKCLILTEPLTAQEASDLSTYINAL